MHIIITGGKGMLGQTLIERLSRGSNKIEVADLPEVDITNPREFGDFIKQREPDVVIHCAARTNVDACEEQEDWAYKVNAYGSANVAVACKRYGARLIAISTDYVFGGESKKSYNEFDKAGGAKSIYGKSKFAGEEAIRQNCYNYCICRISWLYGPSGPSFVHSMLKLAQQGHPVLKVVADQKGNPTSTDAVASQIAHLIKRPELRGTFHMTCEGETTWAVFARQIFRLAEIEQKVEDCTTEEFPRPAPRPHNSSLDKMMIRLVGLPRMPRWEDALRSFMTQYYDDIRKQLEE